MSRNEQALAFQADLPISREGYRFDPASPRWRLSRDRILSMGWMSRTLSPSLADATKKVLIHYAISYSGAHAGNVADQFRAFTVWLSEQRGTIDRVSSSDLISYRSAIGRDREWHIGVLSGLLKTWIDLGIEGVDDTIAQLLNGWRLKGNRKGQAVQVKCPYKGPLSDLEYEGIQQRLLEAYEGDEVELEDFVLVTLFMATGRRPVQLGDLKAIDLIEGRASGGLREFILNVPRRKQRAFGWRKQFKPVALVPEIGLALQGLVQQNEMRFQRIQPQPKPGIMKQLPIFPNWKTIKGIDFEATSLPALVQSEALHFKTESLSYRLRRIVAALDVLSERTGARLEVFPTRLRRTVATRAAREGYGSLVIAELLDHTDDQNARVYTENVPEHVDAINKAVARQLAPLAQAFAGVLVDHEPDAVRGEDAKSRVRTSSGEGAGTCGHYGFCGAYAPVACYTCRHFQPWLDGGHEEVLEELLAERNRVMEVTKDEAMASINDRTIFAVTEVIQQCEARRKEVEGAMDLG